MPDLSAPPPGWGMSGGGPPHLSNNMMPQIRIGHMNRMNHPMSMNMGGGTPHYQFGPGGMERPPNYHGYAPPFVRNPMPQNNQPWEKPK